MRGQKHLAGRSYVGCFITIALCCCCSVSTRSAAQKEGSCVSQGGRFPRFTAEGHPPRKASKGPDDLTLCRIYRKQTCCSAVHTNAALSSLGRLATGGEGSAHCLALWEVLQCAICDPRMGVSPGPPLLCSSFCDSLFDSCANAFFSSDPMGLMPCGPRDTVCAHVREWTSNSSDFCQLAGFMVERFENRLKSAGHLACFDGKAEIVGTMGEGKGSSGRGVGKEWPSRALLDLLNAWVERLDVSEKVLWAIGGLVLTAGAALLRRRSLKSKHKRSALFLRARALQEARDRQQILLKSASTRPSKKG